MRMYREPCSRPGCTGYTKYRSVKKEPVPGRNKYVKTAQCPVCGTVITFAAGYITTEWCKHYMSTTRTHSHFMEEPCSCSLK